VTDDEAFVRAIVAAPADEAPRLVYADWLDERGNPRGAYLRAEAANPGDVDRLRPLAAGLDPVWLARVSRPPAGLCWDRVRFTNAGPPLTPADLDATIARLGVDLAVKYRAFLLNHNGGTPEPNHVPLLPQDEDPEGDDEYVVVERFFSVRPAGGVPFERWQDDLEQVARLLKGLPGNAIGDYLPIATAESDNYFLLAVAGPNHGTVAYFADYTHRSDAEENLIPVADSFATFLDSFVPPR
jgi:uncharacterized protein (TIGR02996 family)